MMSAKEAKEFYTTATIRELEKIDQAIKLTIFYNSLVDKVVTKLTLSTGLTREGKRQQDLLYKDFKGTLEGGTLLVLKSLGYDIITDSNHQGSFITISWE